MNFRITLLLSVLSLLIIYGVTNYNLSATGYASPQETTDISQTTPQDTSDAPILNHTSTVDTLSHSRDVAPPDETDTADQQHLPIIEYSSGSLQVSRDGESHALYSDSTLYPGDVIETGADQFAVLRFVNDWQMIVHPLSLIKFDEDHNELVLNDSRVNIQSDPDISGVQHIPSRIICFENQFAPDDSSEHFSFTIQCRGSSGITATSQKGTLFLTSGEHQYSIPEGNAFAGRASSSRFEEIPAPERPEVIDSIDLKPLEAELEEIETMQFSWQPVTMADQYLVHIYSDNQTTTDHLFRMMPSRNFTVQDTAPGSYYFRVLAIDYYGVSGPWSEPILFHIGETPEETEALQNLDRDSASNFEEIPNPGSG